MLEIQLSNGSVRVLFLHKVIGRMADSDNEKGKGSGNVMAALSLLSAVSVAAISNWDKISQNKTGF
jgi:hypothetical protein